MKLFFEEWAGQQRFSNNVSSLFGESFICYKNGAYRAALMFSYLGFFTVVKEVIIKSTKPNLPYVPQSRWDKIISDLRKDEHWERAVFEELVNSSAAIFNINEDIRQQVRYWKDRRNDCAHFKSNNIDYYHVDALWSFIKSNIYKITVEGGKETLLEKFRRHFDESITPPNSDITPLVKLIDESVVLADMESFWIELFSILEEYNSFPSFNTGSFGFEYLVESVMKNCNSNTGETIIDFVRKSELDLELIYKSPDKINYFNYTSSEVREIWRNRIIENKYMGFIVYGALLRNRLIPYNEIEEANKHIFYHFDDYRPTDESTHMALSANGFGDVIFKIAIEQDKLKTWYSLIQPRADMIAYYVENYSLKLETVKAICDMYTREKYSRWLGERLEKMFRNNPTKKQEFHAIASENGFTIPSKLM
ncbi:hypothetical protein [Fibrella aestuarina]|nr:hypothetical protein [Fibrella aestuarina]